MEKRKFKRYADIRVTVDTEDDESDKVRTRRKRPLEGNKPTEYLPRRKRGELKLNFWDLAQYETAPNVYTDIDTHQVGQHTITSLESAGNVNTTIQPYNFTQLKDAIFAIEPDVNLWSTKFRKFSYERAEKNCIDISIDGVVYPVARNGSRGTVYENSTIADSTWTEEGLIVPRSSTAFDIHAWGFTFQTKGSDTDITKVTETASFSAPEVSFALDADCDVYLMPVPQLWAGDTAVGYPNWPLNGQNNYEQERLGYVYNHWNRAFFIDNPIWTNPHGFFSLRDNFFDGFNRNAWNHWMVWSLPNSRTFWTKTSRSPVVLTGSGYRAATGYPSISVPPPFSFSGYLFAQTILGAGTSLGWNAMPQGVLLMVIKKGSSWYYFWTKTENTTFGGVVATQYYVSPTF